MMIQSYFGKRSNRFKFGMIPDSGILNDMNIKTHEIFITQQNLANKNAPIPGAVLDVFVVFAAAAGIDSFNCNL